MDFEQVTIETPEHVSISYELAGPGSRLMASLFDHLLIALIVSAVVLLAMALDVGLPGGSASTIAIVIVLGGPLVLLSLYFTIFEALWSGQTPGKRAAGLRVMRDDGTPVSPIDVAIRNTVRIVDFLPYLYFVGGFVAFVQKQSKRLGDMAAGTVVVKLRETELPEAVEPAAAADAPAQDLLHLVRPSAGSISPDELRTMERFLGRRFELDPEVREQMARRIMDAIRSKLPPEAAALGDQDPEALFEALAHACSRTGERL